MFTKPSSLHTLGLEREGSLLKGAQLSMSKGKPLLNRVFEIEIDTQSTDVNPLYIDQEGQHLREAANKSLVVTVLDGDEVLVRPLDVKLKKERDIDAVLAFQAEPLLPYPVEGALLDRIVISQIEDGTQLSLIAAKKDHIQQHISNWNSLQIEPEVVSCAPVTLAFFSKQFSPSFNPHFVVDLGKTQTVCILVFNGKLLAAQSSHQGLDALEQVFFQDSPSASKEQFAAIDFASLSQAKTPLLFAALANWRMEITRILYALSKQRKEDEINEILLTGEGIQLKNLATTLCQSSKNQILAPLDIPQFLLPIDQLQRYAIPIGAALSALPGAKDQINFRQDELAYPHPWRRLIKPLGIYFATCLLLTAAIYIFGDAYIGYKEDELRQEYVELLSSINKPYAEFEKQYYKKNPSSLNPPGGIPIDKLTEENINSRLLTIQKDLKDTPDSFPLQPNSPRVSDVLAWLSVHPQVVGGKNPEKGTLLPLQIDSLSYTMVKRPELKKAAEKYQVKVEIEFTSPTPMLAREFHDALITPNDLVDPKAEVKWSSSKGKYRASFFLKDKTMYPTFMKPGA